MVTLQNILKINALSSGVTGLALAIFAKFFAALFAVNVIFPFVEIGIFLVAFSIFVYWVSTKKDSNRQLVKSIIWLDSAWVIGSVIAILFLANNISAVGSLLIGGVAIWVAAMALLQSKALHKITYSSNQ